MNSTSLALIDITAEGHDRSLVTQDSVEKVSEMLGVIAPVPKVDLRGNLRISVEAIIGEDERVTAQELAALSKAVHALPSPEPADSFVWNAVASPADIDRLMKAVMIYHRFNVQAVAVSEKIGANDDFRRFVRQYSGNEETELKSALESERRHADRINSFMEMISSFVEKASGVFEGGDWTIGSILVLTAAVRGFLHSRAMLSSGWFLPQVPTNECLEVVEALRMELAYSAAQVRASHGMNLLGYSLTALSGVRRSLFDGGADFQSALAPFGIEEHDEERLVELANNMRSYLETCDKLEQVLIEGGFEKRDLPSIVSHVLIRKYLMEAAEASGVDWGEVSGILTPRAEVSSEVFVDLLAALEADTFSAKLNNISKDHNQRIANVVFAAEHYVYSRLYWIDAGDRVLSCDPEIRIMDLRSILELEPEIHGNSEVLSRAGAMDRQDVEALERHLEWLIGVYGMPVSNSAITAIVESKGVSLEGLLTEP